LGDTRLQRQAVGEQQAAGLEQSGESLALGNAELHGCDGSSQRGSVGTGKNQGRVLQSERPSASELVADTECLGQQGQGAVGKSQYSTPCGDGQANQPVDDCTREYEWLICPDGKTRPVKRGISLLAHGIQHRTPILHAFGNAIVPQVAAEFIKAASEV
jgi:DNA (cytosine-5)-methyltransferase 1